MSWTTAINNQMRRGAMGLLKQIRRYPVLHRPVHRLAVEFTRVPLGARMVRAVLEPQYVTTSDYQRWIERNDTIRDDDRKAIARHIGTFQRRPLISVVMPAYETDERLLREAIASVEAQLYPHWELCVADDASPGPHVWRVLQEAAARDARIKVVRRESNGHISAASNSALALASGEFVALMDHDDVLPEHALYEVAAAIDEQPDLDLIYSDEDKIDGQGRRFEPYFKTDWNPELLLSHNMVSHLGVYRRALIERVGGLREGFEGSQDYDLTLRVSELTQPSRIRHIPAVLYHWRQQADVGSFSEQALERCADAGRRAVAEHLERIGAECAKVEVQPNAPAWVHVSRACPTPEPLVSVIIPTRDRVELLGPCVEGLLNRTDYPSIELLIVDNGSVEPETHALFESLREDARVRVLPRPGAFNYSALNNSAIAASRGEIVLLLNNDIDVIEGGWLREMVAHAVRPEVGAVGARLLYGDGRVQHGGVILGVGGVPPVAGHLYVGAPRDDLGYFGHLQLTRNVSAVTGACLAMRREVFDRAGGLDEANLAVAFNDVDLCLKVRELGLSVVWTPKAELYHLESASRGSDLRPEHSERFRREINHMRKRWGAALDDDPFYGPNFDRMHGDYRLAEQPLRRKPWMRALESA